jgi:hypothetical protein
MANDATCDLFFGHTGPADRAKQSWLGIPHHDVYRRVMSRKSGNLQFLAACRLGRNFGFGAASKFFFRNHFADIRYPSASG